MRLEKFMWSTTTFSHSKTNFLSSIIMKKVFIVYLSTRTIAEQMFNMWVHGAVSYEKVAMGKQRWLGLTKLWKYQYLSVRPPLHWNKWAKISGEDCCSAEFGVRRAVTRRQARRSEAYARSFP